MMKKIAFIFPGQGSQIAGMGKDFYEQYASSRAVFDKASDITGLDMKKLCFTENIELDQTEYTQVAILTTELAMLAAVKEKGVIPSITAGQSLGEYAALVTSGVLTLEDALPIVRKRGIFMQEAVPLNAGAMVAVIGLKPEAIAELCMKVNGYVEISNFNSPKQSVIAGERSAVLAAKQLADDAGARLTAELKVSTPCHTNLMKPAAEKLKPFLQDVAISAPSISYVANVNAMQIHDAALVRDLLTQQIYSAVRWNQSIETMRDAGVDLFVEIGPGETLAKMNTKIDRTIKTISINSVESLALLAEITG